MTVVIRGVGVPPAIDRLILRLEDRLRALGLMDRLGDVALAVGADDPRLPRMSADRPRVIVPAIRRRSAPPWTASLIASAESVLLFDDAELTGLPASPIAPVVVAGLPRPAEAPESEGLFTEGAPVALVDLWTREVGPPPQGGPGVAWVGGGTLPALCAATEAWAQRRAVVVLPGARPHEILRTGGALLARTSLEVIEATRYLCDNRPLARALADRGRRRVARLAPLDAVARRAAEAIILAGG